MKHLAFAVSNTHKEMLHDLRKMRDRKEDFDGGRADPDKLNHDLSAFELFFLPQRKHVCATAPAGSRNYKITSLWGGILNSR